MGNIIPFRTRQQLEKEKKIKIQKEWEAWEEFERTFAHYKKTNPKENEATSKTTK